MAPSDRGGRRSRVWVAAVSVLLLVFVAGAAAGWTGARRTCRPMRGGPPAGRPAPAWLCGRRGGDPMARLNLSPAERARVESVVKRRQADIRAFWEGPGRQLGAIMDSMHADVRAAIDPAHRPAFDSLPRPGQRGGRRPGADR